MLNIKKRCFTKIATYVIIYVFPEGSDKKRKVVSTMTTSNTFYFDRARNGYTFRRMNRTEWYETSHLIRRFHITDGMLMGSIYEEQFFMVYSGYEGYGVEVEPLHSRARGYIASCRRLYQLANTEEEKQSQLENARNWYNQYVKAH